ncbi:MAG TPA: zf-HC2 domain-containing protein [Gaiellaceae bacterium]|nr:zf-HC2 domain-containing protein [Gaiellaceae bacterium]
MRPEAELTCAEVVELVTDYLEGRLPPEERRRFDEHVSGCDGCVAYLEQMRATIATAGRLRDTDLPPELQERLLWSFRDRRSPG